MKKVIKKLIQKVKNIKKVGVITSQSGAVVQDIISTMRRRNKCIEIIIYPTQVQGQASIENIINAVEIANIRNEVDVIIIARGGGSIEDLWAFNDENVVRSIATSSIATISAIGHETDFTLTDFVADLRAPTPTAAAEIVSDELSLFLEKLRSLKSDSFNIIQHKLYEIYQKIDHYEKRLLSPKEKIKAQNMLVHNFSKRIQSSMQSQLNIIQNKVESLEQGLILLNPNNILSRGYAIAFNEKNIPITNAKKTAVDDKIKIKLHRGLLQTTVTKKVDG